MAKVGVLLVEPNGTGGVWEYTCELAAALCSRAKVGIVSSEDHEKALLTGCVPVVSHIQWERVKGVAGGTGAEFLRKGRNAVRYALGVRAALRGSPKTVYQVVHFQGTYWPPAVLWTAVLCRALGRKFIYTPHNSFSRSSSAFGRALWLVFQRGIVLLSDAVIVLTPFDQAELVARRIATPQKVGVIPYGTTEVHASWPGKQEARERLGLSAHARYVALLGNLRRDKGLEHLLGALPTVMRRVPDARLLVAGSDSDGIGAREIGDLPPQVGNHVDFRPGYFPSEDLPAYFGSADVVCLPYLQASDSAVGHRAQLHGCRIVAYDVGGLRQGLGSDPTITWVESGNIPALGEALVKALNSGRPEGSTARSEAYKPTWQDVANATFVVYQRVLQE